MACRTMQELLAGGEGARVSIVGRYERWAPGPHPPDREPETARLVLEDGTGVLIGRYGSPECIRPSAELEGLAGHTVTVGGTFLRTLPWSGDGPPPGMWTGGGPQVVDIADGPRSETPATVDAAVAPPHASPRPVPREAGPPSSAGRAASTVDGAPPLPGRVRRALVFGPSRWRRVAGAVAALVPASVVAAGCVALSAPSWTLMLAGGIFLAVFYGADALMQALLVGSELERLRRLRIPLNETEYLKWLDVDPRGQRPVVRLELASAAPSDLRGEQLRMAWDLRLEWRSATTLVLRGRRLADQLRSLSPGGTSFNTRGETVAVHRWFLARVAGIAEELHRTCGVSGISLEHDRS